MKQMSQKDRLESIRTIVKTEERVLVSELSERFSVTQETIRRDLEKLEGEGLVARTYGGAVLYTDSLSARIQYSKRAKINLEEKRIIAQLAVDLIPEGQTFVGADSSSTVMETLRLISDREDVLLLTYSASFVQELIHSKLNILCTGGMLNKKSSSFQGVHARSTIQEYNLAVLFLSCKGLMLDGSFFDSESDETEIKQTMMAKAQKKYLLVDHTKFGQLAFVKVGNLRDMDAVITDRKPNESWVDFFNSNGIRLIYPQ